MDCHLNISCSINDNKYPANERENRIRRKLIIVNSKVENSDKETHRGIFCIINNDRIRDNVLPLVQGYNRLKIETWLHELKKQYA